MSNRRIDPGPWQRQLSTGAWTVLAKNPAEPPEMDDDDFDQFEDAGDEPVSPGRRSPLQAVHNVRYAAQVHGLIRKLGVDVRALDAFVAGGVAGYVRGSRDIRSPTETAILYVAAFTNYISIQDPGLPDRLRQAAIAWQDTGVISQEVARDVLDRLA